MCVSILKGISPNLEPAYVNGRCMLLHRVRRNNAELPCLAGKEVLVISKGRAQHAYIIPVDYGHEDKHKSLKKNWDVGVNEYKYIS